MRRAVRFLILLVGGLAMLAIIGHVVLTRTTSAWFERDLALRSRLAIDAARISLASHWGDRARLADILGDITRDERIMAAAACTSGDELLAATESYPAAFTCAIPRLNAERFGLGDAAELRRRERMLGRLATSRGAGA